MILKSSYGLNQNLRIFVIPIELFDKKGKNGRKGRGREFFTFNGNEGGGKYRPSNNKGIRKVTLRE